MPSVRTDFEMVKKLKRHEQKDTTEESHFFPVEVSCRPKSPDKGPKRP